MPLVVGSAGVPVIIPELLSVAGICSIESTSALAVSMICEFRSPFVAGSGTVSFISISPTAISGAGAFGVTDFSPGVVVPSSEGPCACTLPLHFLAGGEGGGTGKAASGISSAMNSPFSSAIGKGVVANSKSSY